MYVPLSEYLSEINFHWNIKKKKIKISVFHVSPASFTKKLEVFENFAQVISVSSYLWEVYKT